MLRFLPTTACLAATLLAQSVEAARLYLDYEANPLATIPAGVFPPGAFGWVDNGSAGAGASVINDAGLGVNSWRVTDSSTALPNPSYVVELGPTATTDATRDGWRFEAYARYVSDFGGAANMGLSVYLNQRAYHLMFDLNAAGDLQATLHGRAGGPTVLTSGGSGIAAYHRLTLESAGGTSVVATFDGQPIGAAWTGVGVAAAHANIALWGNSNQALTGRGVMDFHEVAFTIGPIVDLAADADGDDDVDGLDLLAWQRTLGSTTQLAADANQDQRVNGADLAIWRSEFGDVTESSLAHSAGVPEPASIWPAVTAVTIYDARRRRRRG